MKEWLKNLSKLEEGVGGGYDLNKLYLFLKLPNIIKFMLFTLAL